MNKNRQIEHIKISDYQQNQRENKTKNLTDSVDIHKKELKLTNDRK